MIRIICNTFDELRRLLLSLSETHIWQANNNAKWSIFWAQCTIKWYLCTIWGQRTSKYIFTGHWGHFLRMGLRVNLTISCKCFLPVTSIILWDVHVYRGWQILFRKKNPWNGMRPFSWPGLAKMFPVSFLALLPCFSVVHYIIDA